MNSIQELYDNWQNYGFMASGRCVPFNALFRSVSWHPVLQETIIFEIDDFNRMFFKLNDQGDICTVNIDSPHAECQISHVVKISD